MYKYLDMLILILIFVLFSDVIRSIDPWCNGNTRDFGSRFGGSNPSGSTNIEN